MIQKKQSLFLTEDMLDRIEIFFENSEYEPPHKEDYDALEVIAKRIIAFGNDPLKTAAKYNEAINAGREALRKAWDHWYRDIPSFDPKKLYQHFGSVKAFLEFEKKGDAFCDKAFDEAFNKAEFWTVVDGFYDRLHEKPEAIQ